jgi:hypothetical protein
MAAVRKWVKQLFGAGKNAFPFASFNGSSVSFVNSNVTITLPVMNILLP